MSFASHAVNMGEELNLKEVFCINCNMKDTGSVFCDYTVFDR
jgi:hypothetical protein